MANDVTDLRGWAERTGKPPAMRKGAGPTGAHGGEGSRGGHIVGHTKSGVPIYQSASYKSAQQLVQHVEGAHAGMTAAEHGEAAQAHREAAKEAGKGTPAAAVHEAHARAHELVGANKALAQHFGGQAASGISHGMDYSAPLAHGVAPTVGPHGQTKPPEYVKQDAEVSGLAHAATAKLRAEGGTAEDHMNASGLHGAAANVARAAGDHTKGLAHDQLAVAHSQMASKGGGKGPPDPDKMYGGPGPAGAAVDAAHKATSDATKHGTREAHVDAMNANSEAAQKLKEAGKSTQAREHEDRANFHRQAATKLGFDKMNAEAGKKEPKMGDPGHPLDAGGFDKAKMASNAARHATAAAAGSNDSKAHRDASNAHAAAAEARTVAAKAAQAKEGPKSKTAEEHLAIGGAHLHAAQAHAISAKAASEPQYHGVARAAHVAAAEAFKAQGMTKTAGEHQKAAISHSTGPAADDRSVNTSAREQAKGAPPEQNPMSKVRAKLEGGSKGTALSGPANEATKAAAVSGSATSHDIAADKHSIAAKDARQKGLTQDAGYHKAMKAAHVAAAKATRSKAADGSVDREAHQKAHEAFEAVPNHPSEPKQAVANLSEHHHRLGGGR